MNAQQKTQVLVSKLYEEMVGSCSCLTKTPEVSCHAEDCKYRILMDCATRLERSLRHKGPKTEEGGLKHKQPGLVKNPWVGENEEGFASVSTKEKLFHYISQSVVLAAVVFGSYAFWELHGFVGSRAPCFVAVLGMLLCLMIQEFLFRRCLLERNVL